MNPSSPINCAQIYNFRPKSNENTYVSPSSDKLERVSAKIIENRQVGFQAGSDESVVRPLSSSNIKSWGSSVESVEHLPFAMD